MPFVDMMGLKARDLWLKGGDDLDTESSNLKDLYLGQGRDLTLAHLQKMGQGDRKNLERPFQTKLLKRFVKTAAVVWATPPTRRVGVAGVSLGDDDPKVELVSRIYQRSRINSYLKSVDRWRTLLGQAIIYVNPPQENRPEKLPIRVFWPHAVMRNPTDTAQDDITQDEALAFLVYRDPRTEAKSIWHYWRQVEPDQWEAFRVYFSGELVDDNADAIFPGGRAPFEGCPFLQVYDELPEGRAWLPIDETRSAFQLATNIVMNDVLYLLKQEAHSVIGVTGITNQRDMPKRWGPGEMWGFEDPETRLHLLALNPKLAESIAISRHVLEIFAGGEGLPGDYFLATRKYETGAAGRLRQQDLDARRQDQLQDGLEVELELFDIIRNLWNTYRANDGDRIDPLLSMGVELGRQWYPTDLATLQQTYAFDISIGAASMIDYLMERDRLTREQAIDKYERIQADREVYVVRENPASLIQGRNNAGAPGSSSSFTGRPPDPEGVEPDASSMNPDRAASNEAGSVAGAARRSLEIGSSPGAN